MNKIALMGMKYNMVDYPNFEEVYNAVKDDDLIKDDLNEWLDGEYCKKKKLSDQKCREQFKKILEDAYDDGCGNVGDAEDSEKVYRAISVPNVDVFLKELEKNGKTVNHKTGKEEGIGVYWGKDEYSAIPYWGDENDKKMHTITIEAEIDPDEHIDVMESIKSEVLYRREEGEIRLKSGTKPIIITSIEIDNDYNKKIDNIRWKAFI